MKLTLISIPIGNIEDITIRSLRAIFSYELILAEDTRNYIKLRNILAERFEPILLQLKLNPRHQPELISYRDQNHDSVIHKIFNLEYANSTDKTNSENPTKTIGFMSDAGMPAISDPGYKLVKEFIERGYEVEILPGPTAVESALVLSGLPTDKYTFISFLPRQQSKIKSILQNNNQNTIIFYESPFRLIRALKIIQEIGDFQVAACNDLTKKFEKIIRGDIKTVISNLERIKVQGEWTVVIKLQNS
jgi:16S rRNA (cytidine1402-2'-O)-methyltransferase